VARIGPEPVLTPAHTTANTDTTAQRGSKSLARLKFQMIFGGLAVATLATACSSTSQPTSTAANSAAPSSSSSSAVSLAGVCPSTIVVQTDWNPEADQFAAYELAASNGTIDTSKKTYTADLLSQGQDTGVKIQIRAGGPAIGNQLVSADMYEDNSILLGYVESDVAVELSQTQPTVSLIADRDEAPTVIAWSPAEHPKDKTIKELGQDGTTVLYYQGAPFMDYLVGADILKKSQLNGAYNGTPATFVASGGKDALQGYDTAEPYLYAHEVSQWDKPLTYELVSDYGYNPYPTLATLPANVTKYAACFKKLVPIIQQGIVNYAASPAAADALIVKLAKAYNDGWEYNAGEAAYAAKKMVTDKIIANSSDGTVGSFDDSRIQKFITDVSPVYKSIGKTVKPGLTAQDVATNEFIDSSIHLPSGS
jgi:hypothetical protein